LAGPSGLSSACRLRPLGAFFGFDLGADRGAFFFFDLLLAELATLILFGGVADLVSSFFGGLLELALGLTQAAGELGNLRATEKQEGYGEDGPENGAVEHGEVERHRIAVAGIG
jgi:hypothetical protein